MPTRDYDRLYGAKASMEPVSAVLRYRPVPSDGQGGWRELSVACGAGLAVCSAGDGLLEAEVAFDGEVLEVAAAPACDLVLEECVVTLRHAFATDEHVLLNGYQSWTDTAERPAWERMRGLGCAIAPVAKRFALGGSGDYAIVDYSGKRGHQHGFTYATFRRGEGAVLVGSLDESRGFTLIGTDAAHGVVSLRTECPMRPVKGGVRAVLGRYAICRGTVKRCYDRWFELMGVSARPAPPIVGYTSWYRHYGRIDREVLSADLESCAGFFASAGTPRLGGVDKLFQIDDGYCKVGDWLEPDAAKFPQGMAPLAREAEEAGFVPGLWLAPFVCERESRLFASRPEWLLRDSKGDPVRAGSHWSGSYALDTRNVDVRSYVLEVLQTVTREWGFKLVKLDFLYAACMAAHSGLNRGELMADAMALLRRGVGEDVRILGCGVPLASAFGVADYCRIGCDVGLDWDDKPAMRLLHRERVSTKNSLANTYARSPLDGRAFGNDPDVFFLRSDVKLTDEQRDELLFADADLGSVLLTSDDMGEWSNDMRQRYNEALRVFVQRARK